MRRQSLLDEGRSRAREAENEDRLRSVAPHCGARQDARPRFGEKAFEALGQLPRRLLLIDEPAQLAALPLAFREGGKGLVVAAEPVEQSALFEKLVGAEAASAILRGTVEYGQRLGIAAGAAVQDGAGQQNA